MKNKKEEGEEEEILWWRRWRRGRRSLRGFPKMKMKKKMKIKTRRRRITWRRRRSLWRRRSRKQKSPAPAYKAWQNWYMMIKHRVQHATTTAEAEIITSIYYDFFWCSTCVISWQIWLVEGEVGVIILYESNLPLCNVVFVVLVFPFLEGTKTIWDRK